MSEKKIKVTDKRMFTPDGELRDEFRPAESEPEVAEAAPSETAGEVTSAPAIESGAQEPDQTPPGGRPYQEPTIYDLVQVLAQPVALYLGDAALPDGESMENLDLARLHIDLLNLLKERTKGNLTPQESTFLDDLLYQLRLRYIEKRG